jgi:hypothetical protein
MRFSFEQRRVIIGMSAGLVCAGVALAMGVTSFGLQPMPEEFNDRLKLFAAVVLIVSVPLFFAIARLAKHRFLTSDDIAGGGHSGGTQKARLLQAMLQNTLEQTLLAILAYFSWAVLAPADWGALLGLASAMFVLGRILFFLGYEKGAGGRAFGFTLTFYPTVGMIACILPYALFQIGKLLYS